jgi:hypothetical protein
MAENASVPPFDPHNGCPHGIPPKHHLKFFGGLTPDARFEHKKAMVEKLKGRIEEQYLKDVDESIPIHWLTATVARLILAKMTLVCYFDCQALLR